MILLVAVCSCVRLICRAGVAGGLAAVTRLPQGAEPVSEAEYAVQRRLRGMHRLSTLLRASRPWHI
jgi:hypothetical protein